MAADSALLVASDHAAAAAGAARAAAAPSGGAFPALVRHAHGTSSSFAAVDAPACSEMLTAVIPQDAAPRRA